MYKQQKHSIADYFKLHNDYSQNCIKRLHKGRMKKGFLIEVVSYLRLLF